MSLERPQPLPGETPDQFASRLSQNLELVGSVEASPSSEFVGAEAALVARAAQQQTQADAMQAAALMGTLKMADANQEHQQSLATRNRLFEELARIVAEREALPPVPKIIEDNMLSFDGQTYSRRTDKPWLRGWIAKAYARFHPAGDRQLTERARLFGEQDGVKAKILDLDKADFQLLDKQFPPEIDLNMVAKAFLAFVSERIGPQLKSQKADRELLRSQIGNLSYLFDGSDRAQFTPEVFGPANKYLMEARKQLAEEMGEDTTRYVDNSPMPVGWDTRPKRGGA